MKTKNVILDAEVEFFEEEIFILYMDDDLNRFFLNKNNEFTDNGLDCLLFNYKVEAEEYLDKLIEKLGK